MISSRLWQNPHLETSLIMAYNVCTGKDWIMPALKCRRINLRASVEQEGLLRRVAQRRGQSLTDFVVQSACEMAEQELADETRFKLSTDKWQAFVEALDRPARVHPRLRRLLAEPSILESTASRRSSR
jgi:uncharacterized protein (DUF1778 family)